MNFKGVLRARFVLWVCLVTLLGFGIYFGWNWGRIEFYSQRLGAEDRDVALDSELSLLSLGTPGREVLYDYLLKKLNIKLPPLSFDKQQEPCTAKIIAVSETGEVEVAGGYGPSLEVLLLADSSTPVEAASRPLAELARAGTVRILGGVLTSGTRLGYVEIDLVFVNPGQSFGYLILRMDEDSADLEGVPVASSRDIESVLKGRDVGSIRVLPRAGVRFSRFLRFVYNIHACGKRPIIVFGDAGVFGRPSLNELEELNKGLNAPEAGQQTRAAIRLKTAMGNLFAYDTAKTPAQNRTVIEDWNRWFERNEDYLFFDSIVGVYDYNAAAAAIEMENQKYWAVKLKIIKNGVSENKVLEKNNNNKEKTDKNKQNGGE